MPVPTVPVYEFQLADGTPMGCGTQAELDYWTAEGVFVDYVRGGILGYEPASMDDKRRAAWAKISNGKAA